MLLCLLVLLVTVLVQTSFIWVFANTVSDDGGEKQLVSGPVYDANNKTTQQMMDDIDEMKRRLEEINKEIEDSYGKIADSQSSIEAQLAAIAAYDRMVESYGASINKIEEIIAKYDELIALKEEEIKKNQEEFDANYAVFMERLRQTYEEGTPGILEMFFSSDSFMDMLTSLERAKDVLAYDTHLMEKVAEEKKLLDEQKQEIITLRKTQEQEKEHYVELVGVAQAKEQESLDYIKMLESDIETYQALINMTQTEEQQINKNIDDAIEELKKVTDTEYTLTKKYKELVGVPEEIRGRMEKGEIQKGSEYFADGAEHIWPVEMQYFYGDYFTSAFGRRTISIGGVVTTRNHNGIDLGVPKNTEVYASMSGTVITATYSSSYGNYIIILHDNGSRTLYAHNTKLQVVVGEYVFQGEIIAASGMTGRVTGYHVHYEYRDTKNSFDNPVYHMIMPTYFKRGTKVPSNYYFTHF